MISLDDDGMRANMLGELLSLGTGDFCLASGFVLDDEGIDGVAVLIVFTAIFVFHRS